MSKYGEKMKQQALQAIQDAAKLDLPAVLIKRYGNQICLRVNGTLPPDARDHASFKTHQIDASGKKIDGTSFTVFRSKIPLKSDQEFFPWAIKHQQPGEVLYGTLEAVTYLDYMLLGKPIPEKKTAIAKELLSGNFAQAQARAPVVRSVDAPPIKLNSTALSMREEATLSSYVSSRGISEKTLGDAILQGFCDRTWRGLRFIGRNKDQAMFAETRLIKPYEKDGKIIAHHSEGTKAFAPILRGTSGEVHVVEGGFDALALRQMHFEAGQDHTIIMTAGNTQKEWLDVHADVFKSATAITIWKDVEDNHEIQETTDRYAAEVQQAIEEKFDITASISTPPCGGDVAEWLLLHQSEHQVKIVKTMIKTSVDVLCPSCKKLMAKITAHEIETPDSRLLLRFGYEIKAPWAEPTANSDSGAFLAYDVCTGCGADFDVARGDFRMRSQSTSNGFLSFDMKKVKVNHYICHLEQQIGGVPKKWILFEYVTPAGIFHSHRFGPFPCARDHERASGVLQKVWSAMRQMNLDDSIPTGNQQ